MAGSVSLSRLCQSTKEKSGHCTQAVKEEASLITAVKWQLKL